MTNSVRMEVIDHIIERLEDYKSDAEKASKKDKNDLFASGRMLAYEEMLDVIRMEIEVNCE